MISLKRLTKRYGEKLAVDDITVDILPGKVTGFLGPNGAGKSTTMRMIVGHDQPTSGETLIHGKRYAELRHPLREVGALLDARALHPGRTAQHHLLAMARSNGIPRRRVDEVIDMVGLDAVASRRAGGYSLGMGRRLGIAGALLGYPAILMFDEPVNGLDLEGVRWVRGLARSLVAEGRTVFISSHLLTEMQLTADHLVVIGKGRLIADEPMAEMVDTVGPALVRVRSPEAERLTDLVSWFESEGRTVERPGVDTVLVHGVSVEDVGDAAHRLGVSAIVLQVAYSVIVGLAGRSQQSGSAMSAAETAAGGMLYMARFAVVALATLTIASEYATGSIRSTLLYVPIRGRTLAAKSIVAGSVLFVAGVVLALLGTVIVMWTMAKPARSSIGDILSHALAIGGYAGLVTVLVIGLGAIRSSVAGTLTVTSVVMLVVPVALILSKLDVFVGARNFFPGPAGVYLMDADTSSYGCGVALLVLAVWAALAQFAGYVVLRARNA